MIIDLILDRKDGEPYNAKKFYNDVMEYETIFNMKRTITIAMDYGTNNDIQNALSEYIEKGGYNQKINDYIYSVNWI